MYSNFGEIGQTVKTLVQQFQAKAKSHQVSFHVTKINVMDSWGEHPNHEQYNNAETSALVIMLTNDD